MKPSLEFLAKSIITRNHNRDKEFLRLQEYWRSVTCYICGDADENDLAYCPKCKNTVCSGHFTDFAGIYYQPNFSGCVQCCEIVCEKCHIGGGMMAQCGSCHKFFHPGFQSCMYFILRPTQDPMKSEIICNDCLTNNL